MHLSMASNAVILYRVLPSLAAAIAGYMWGGAILDSSRCKTYGQSALKGLKVSVGAYIIFSVLYACELPLLEGQWSLQRAGSIGYFVLALGPLMVGPTTALAGTISGITLYSLGRRIVNVAKSDSGAKSV